MTEKVTGVRKAKLYEALISFIGLIAVMAIGIGVYGTDPHIPMLVGVVIAAVMSLKIGYSWKQIEASMIDGISKAMQSILILAIIGVLIGIWMLSGVVPSMIYYGLFILTPKIFLPAAVIICSITSLATGTSWGTAGTMGVALMGIGHGLGIPAPITAGAVLSGAYFGDKMSPLSDTTNLAPAMAGTDVFTHVKYMLNATVVTYIITLVAFTVIGLNYGSGAAELGGIELIQNSISSQFNITPLLLIPPIVVIVLIAFKMPAIPGLLIGIIIAGAMYPIFQSNADFGNIFSAGMDGYESTLAVGAVESALPEGAEIDAASLETLLSSNEDLESLKNFLPEGTDYAALEKFVEKKGDFEAIDDLLTKGGLNGMMFSISMTIIAMMFGGIVEMTGQMEIIVKQILKLVKSDAGLVVATEATCIFSNATMPEQYISIVVPGRMYAQAYIDRGLHPKTLSNALESAGTVSGVFMPWHTCGVFMEGALGCPAWGPGGYAVYAIFNYVQIVVTGVMAYMGLTVAKMTEEEKKILAETGTVS